MLNTWDKQYYHRASQLEIKFRKALLKLSRWWIYYKYSGDPNNDPCMLTSRPKNIPLISLRTDEYSEFLQKKEFVTQKWREFWNNGETKHEFSHNPYNYKIKNTSGLEKANLQRFPLKDIDTAGNNKENLTFNIYHDHISKGSQNCKFQMVNTTDYKKIKNTNDKKRIRIPLESPACYSYFLDDKYSGNKSGLSFEETPNCLIDMNSKIFYKNDSVQEKEALKLDSNDFFNGSFKLDGVEYAYLNEINMSDELSHTGYCGFTIKRTEKKRPGFKPLKLDNEENKNNTTKLKSTRQMCDLKYMDLSKQLKLNLFPINNNENCELPLMRRSENLDHTRIISKNSRFNNFYPPTDKITPFQKYQIKKHAKAKRIKRIFKKGNRKIIMPTDLAGKKQAALFRLQKLKDKAKRKVGDLSVFVFETEINKGYDILIETLGRSEKNNSKKNVEQFTKGIETDTYSCEKNELKDNEIYIDEQKNIQGNSWQHLTL